MLPNLWSASWSPIATVSALIILGANTHYALSARILGIFPTPSISHQMPFQTIMKALVARGHEVTVISPNPLKEPLANYTDVDLSFSYEIWHNHCKFSSMSHLEGSEFVQVFFSVLPIYTEEQLLSPQLREFRRLNKNETFDLVIFEWLSNYPYFGLVHEVGSPPIVGILSIGLLSEIHRSIGNPDFPSINPTLVYRYSDSMSFWQRLHNIYVKFWMRFFWNNLMTRQEELMRKYFGEAPPPIRDVNQNISLLIASDSYITDFPRALMPNLLQVTGLHIKENPEPLPQDLQEWMDDSTEGIVYFSLGSNVKSKDLPESMHAAIVAALARLPLRVLWKWEEDELPGRPSNVRVAKWLPQQAVLAHPNMRLFITQGGLQSFQEALYYGVPLLGIPFIGDQPKNVLKMSLAGIGRHLEFCDITEDTFYGEITELLKNPKYKERMTELSEIYREQKESALDSAVWWIEYVLRHKGAPHLRTDALSLPWYQYLLLDVVAVILLIVGFLGCMSFLLRRLLPQVACSLLRNSNVSSNMNSMPYLERMSNEKKSCNASQLVVNVVVAHSNCISADCFLHTHTPCAVSSNLGNLSHPINQSSNAISETSRVFSLLLPINNAVENIKPIAITNRRYELYSW